MSAPCPLLGFVVRVGAGVRLVDLRALLHDHDLTTDSSPGARELAIYREGSQATDADRQIIREWAAREAADIEISDLVDLAPGA